MKTIIIDLPPNVNPTGAAYAIADVAHNIGRGNIVLVPPFHYNIDTSVGPVTVRSEAEPDNQAHPPLGTTLAAFTAGQIDNLPVGSMFGPGDVAIEAVEKKAGRWVYPDGSTATPFNPLGWDGTRPLVRVGPVVTSTHPPLNTPLSAFTPAMLDALPVGSAFGPGEEISGVVVKDDRGWRPAAGDRYAPDFGAPGWDLTRPLIRVGPEQASEPAPSATLPDPAPVREPLPFPVRRYGSCRTWNRPDGEGRFDVGYEFFGCAAGPRDVSESRTFDTDAEGHAWLLSVMMDPGPLPDPWPGTRFEYKTEEGGWARATVDYVYADPDGPTFVLLAGDDHGDADYDGIEWCPENIREVRTPDGATLWKRPAAKVTS